jgi:membrane dipeptidase
MASDLILLPDENLIRELAGPQTREKVPDRLFIVDGHVDLPYFMMGLPEDQSLGDLREGPFTLEKAERSGIRLFCSAIYCEDRFNGEASPSRLEQILQFIVDHYDPVPIIRDLKELKGLQKDPDLLATLLLLENADALATDLSCAETLKDRGVRMVGLTHVGRNRLADGNNVAHSDGISDKGREVIGVLEKNGLAIDVAHLHSGCFWQLLDMFRGPILDSHTGVRNLYDIPRNIDLEQAGEIFQRDGIVGITFNPEMLSSRQDENIERVFSHLDTLVQKFGPEGAAIGSDFCGFDSASKDPEGAELVPMLADSMLAHGYGRAAVKAIMGGNWIRFYEKLYQT